MLFTRTRPVSGGLGGQEGLLGVAGRVGGTSNDIRVGDSVRVKPLKVLSGLLGGVGSGVGRLKTNWTLLGLGLFDSLK
jgi:hypothetical protein